MEAIRLTCSFFIILVSFSKMNQNFARNANNVTKRLSEHSRQTHPAVGDQFNGAKSCRSFCTSFSATGLHPHTIKTLRSVRTTIVIASRWKLYNEYRKLVSILS